MPISRDQIFSRKNARILLGFMGACMVFFTFVVKDDRRDDMKSLADAIDGAENIFIIRTENAKLDDEQRRVAQELNQFRRDFQNHPYRDSGSSFGEGSGGGWSSWGFTETQFKANREKEQNIEVAFDNIARLLRKLPQTGTYLPQIGAVKHDMEQFETLSEEIDSLWLREQTVSSRDHTPERQKLDQELDDKADQLEALLSRISDSTNILAKGILDKAEQAREKAEKSFQFWNRLSYVLYFLGAVLTMVGVAIGVEGSEGSGV